MGRQIRTLVTDADMALMEDELRARGFALLMYFQEPGRLRHVPTLSRQEYTEPLAWAVLEGELSSVHLASFGADRYTIDRSETPAIEIAFGPGLDHPDPGRLSYETNHVVSGQWVPWSSTFLAAADSVFRWVRGEFVRAEDGQYLGPNAARRLGIPVD